MLRIIQKRIFDSGEIEPDPDAYQSKGLNRYRIQEIFLKWRVDLVHGDWYRFMDVDDLDLQLVLEAFDMKIPAKLYRKGDMEIWSASCDHEEDMDVICAAEYIPWDALNGKRFLLQALRGCSDLRWSMRCFMRTERKTWIENLSAGTR